MACYIISYDLVKARDYEALYKAIKDYGTWAHVHDSVWAVVTTSTAVEIRDYLQRYVDSDDRIFVIKSGSEAAWRGVLCKNEWLKDNL
jgi:hypothetical protein